MPLLLAMVILAAGCAPCDVRQEPKASRAIRQKGYRWINPLLDYEDAAEFRELRPFRASIEDLIARLRDDSVESVSVYFRDLNNGPWFGVNERDAFMPASLLKLPLMMGYLARSQADPGLLKRRLEYPGPDKEAMRPNYQPSTPLAPGASYSIEELIERMIVYSDNEASLLLEKYGGQKELLKTYEDLGLEVIMVGRDHVMSVKQYASFFRILYNASYLNRDLSERALQYLSRTEFKEGIPAGVAESVPVSHKFGERTYTGRELKQLHDCGIVYHPDTTYLLCVMTKGREFPKLLNIIQEVSRLAYREVDAQARTRPRRNRR